MLKWYSHHSSFVSVKCHFYTQYRYVQSASFQCIVYSLICTDADTFIPMQFGDERFKVECNVKSERTKNELKFNLDNFVQVNHIGVRIDMYSYISYSHTSLFVFRIYGSYRHTLYKFEQTYECFVDIYTSFYCSYKHPYIT